jgi:hypothetical protein
MVLRPYLAESVVGDGFQWSNFLAMVGFVLVLGLWLWLASPMVRNLLGFVTGKQPNVQHEVPITSITSTPGKGLLQSVVRVDSLNAVTVGGTENPEMTVTKSYLPAGTDVAASYIHTVTPAASHTPTLTKGPLNGMVGSPTPYLYPTANFTVEPWELPPPTATRAVIVSTPAPQIVYVEVTKIVEEIIKEEIIVYVEVTPTETPTEIPTETPTPVVTDVPYPGPMDTPTPSNTPIYVDPPDCTQEVCTFLPLVSR